MITMRPLSLFFLTKTFKVIDLKSWWVKNYG
jgi:hypothetical protein